mmetsp:Transcript_6587/g.19957  ORF Transcript_6587/g.19957 Transcript_6587/m.19957 type:complete len:480 (-) Transcript_6587:254-1693(-)
MRASGERSSVGTRRAWRLGGRRGATERTTCLDRQGIWHEKLKEERTGRHKKQASSTMGGTLTKAGGSGESVDRVEIHQQQEKVVVQREKSAERDQTRSAAELDDGGVWAGSKRGKDGTIREKVGTPRKDGESLLKAMLPKSGGADDVSEAEAAHTVGFGSEAEGPRDTTSEGFECPICLLTFGEGTPRVFPAQCRHSVCTFCAVQYIAYEIQNRAVPIRCPQEKCSSSFAPEQVAGLVSEELYSKFEQYLIIAALQTDPDLRFCPTPDCGFAVIGHPKEPVITCETCEKQFCFKCSNHWEPGHVCKLLIADGLAVKECPRCRSLIEKVQDGTCNHMVCSNCHCDFCWLCGEEVYEFKHYWTPSGCTYYGKKKWNRTTKAAVTAGILVTGPVLVALGIVVVAPYITMSLPVKAIQRAQREGKSRIQSTGAGIVWTMFSPIAFATSVAIGVPFGLGVIYGYVPYTVVKQHFTRKQKTPCGD